MFDCMFIFSVFVRSDLKICTVVFIKEMLKFKVSYCPLQIHMVCGDPHSVIAEVFLVFMVQMKIEYKY